MSERIIPNPGFDILGDILETLRFRGSIFFSSALAAPWGIALANKGTPRFHIVFSGSCFVGAKGVDAVEAGHMDIILLPKGNEHWIADKPDRRLVASENTVDACELGQPLFQDGLITHRIMCGKVQFDEGSAHPIFDTLPEIIRFSMGEIGDDIWSLIHLIDKEFKTTCELSGRNHITDRLTEVLFLKLLNLYVGRKLVDNNTQSDDQLPVGFLSAIADKRIRMALSLIHQEPGFDWSLDLLGERVGMSRATLVRHFQEKVGAAPMAYLNSWRRMKAYNAIKYTSLPLDQIATSVGFTSARTLGRAIVRHYGMTPTRIRGVYTQAS